MSYYLFMAQVISKSNRSAVACAAYRSGEQLYSERDGLTKQYGERDVKPDTYILSPENAPEWANDREKLWNEVEKVEKQINSQLAREIVMALPKELSDVDQRDLLLDFCKENFSDEGMVADISIHRDKEHNPHAHVMLTMRPFDEDGNWGNKRKKVNGKSVHLTDWNKKETLVRWRGNFAEKINEKFQERGMENRVSHESYSNQGIDKVAHIRLKREDYQLEKRVEKQAEKEGKKYEPVTHYGKLNKELHEINNELKELKKEKVVSLESRKEDKHIDKSLESIRKNASLSDVQKASLTMVGKRAKTYVDYAVAANIYSEIKDGNWKKKLDSQKLKLTAEKNLINKVHHTYKENPNNVIKYGLNPKNYSKEMSLKINDLKELQTEYKGNLIKYDAILKKAELALEVQKDFTKQEFEHLYTGKSNDYQIQEMYHAVQQFKSKGELLLENQIKPFADQNEIKGTKQISVEDQTRNISKSIFILDRAMKKQTNNRMDSLKVKNLNGVYEATQKLETYQLQKNNLTKELEGNKTFLRAELSNIYDAKEINNISHAETLVRLNSMSKNGKLTGNLQKDIKLLHNEHKQLEAKAPQPKNANQQIEQKYVSSVGDALLQSFDAIQKTNEEQKQKQEPKERRKKRKREKGMDHDL